MDERIDSIATKVDRMDGVLDQYCKNQETIIANIIKKQEQHDQHIRGLTSWQDNADGRIWGIGIGVPAILAFIAKVTGFFH